jgi:hypothetical protein
MQSCASSAATRSLLAPATSSERTAPGIAARTRAAGGAVMNPLPVEERIAAQRMREEYGQRQDERRAARGQTPSWVWFVGAAVVATAAGGFFAGR